MAKTYLNLDELWKHFCHCHKIPNILLVVLIFEEHWNVSVTTYSDVMMHWIQSPTAKLFEQLNEKWPRIDIDIWFVSSLRAVDYTSSRNIPLMVQFTMEIHVIGVILSSCMGRQYSWEIKDCMKLD